jgi:uncharacterized membrane protein YecN with MAPEG domain
MQFVPSVTILYAGIFGLLLLVLSLNIFREWVNVAAGVHNVNEERWKRAERVQHSFVEFVPMSLLLLFLIEAHGAPRLILHAIGIALLTARVLHAYGMGSSPRADIFRVVGTQTTFLTLMVSSLAAIYYALFPALLQLLR